MKLVVEIPDEEYEAIIGNVSSKFSVYDLIANVKNATPLSKYFMRDCESCKAEQPPLEKVLGEIKAEIKRIEYKEGEGFDDYSEGYLRMNTIAQRIIDSHISGKEQE